VSQTPAGEGSECFGDDRNRDRESIARLKTRENTLSQWMSQRNQSGGMVGVQ
jgi:hypothetical protein